MDEVCKQHKVKPQLKHIISDLLDKVSSEQLDDQFFQGNDRFDEENGPCEAFKRVFKLLDMEQTLKAIIALKPSRTRKLLNLLSGE